MREKSLEIVKSDVCGNHVQFTRYMKGQENQSFRYLEGTLIENFKRMLLMAVSFNLLSSTSLTPFQRFGREMFLGRGVCQGLSRGHLFRIIKGMQNGYLFCQNCYGQFPLSNRKLNCLPFVSGLEYVQA